MYDAGSISLLTLMTMTSDSISLFNTQALFPKRKFSGNLNPPLSQRISVRYIADFRRLSNKYQKLICDDTVDDINIAQEIRCKCMGINLFDVSKLDIFQGEELVQPISDE